MGKLNTIAEKCKSKAQGVSEGVAAAGSVYAKIKYVIGVIIMCFYRLRSLFLAAPVAWYALKLAAYNREHLPEQVGVNLLSNGAFDTFISRDLAVTAPLVVTGACLVLMCVSRKALYPWAVSIFTLILPVLLLISNLYPM